MASSPKIVVSVRVDHDRVPVAHRSLKQRLINASKSADDMKPFTARQYINDRWPEIQAAIASAQAHIQIVVCGRCGKLRQPLPDCVGHDNE